MAQKSKIEINENIGMICTACDSCWLIENGYPYYKIYFLTEKKYANTGCPFKVKLDEEGE